MLPCTESDPQRPLFEANPPLLLRCGNLGF
jgi:hypothetical protein